MANPFANEIKWWENRARDYDLRRAEIKPISFDYISRTMSDKGNYNGASTFNAARARLFAEDAEWRKNMVIMPKPGEWQPGDSRLKPSEDVAKLKAQNDTTASKIKALGGNAFRGAVSGLMGLADIISRPGYALRASSETYAKANAADGNTSFWEHVENAVRPIVDLPLASVAIPYNAITGGSDETYTAMWEGFTGKRKTSGEDLLKIAFPEFTSDHKKWTSALSFGVDVAYDPLSWLTVGQGTVISGAGKGVAAVGARAVGKKSLSKELLSNTVWTSTGRAGGREAVKESIYLRASKPLVKKKAKLDKAVVKNVRQYEKSVKKGNKTKEQEYFDRWQKSRKIYDDTVKQLDADIAAVRSESFTGMQLAWKAVANKSLGLTSVQAYGKGVNTAGLKSKSAREFVAMQNATHDEIKNTFKSPDSASSQSWRAAHKDMMDSGTTSFTYKTGKTERTFEVSDDYDKFVDDISEILFPRARVSEVTKKDMSMRFGTATGKDANAKRFYYTLQQNMNRAADVRRGGVKDLVWSARQGKYVKREKYIKENEAVISDLQTIRQRAKSPGDTETIHAVKVADAEAKAAQEVAIRASEEALGLAKTNAVRAAAKRAEAAAAQKVARTAATKASNLRKAAEAEEALIQSQVDALFEQMRVANASSEDNIVAAVANQTDSAAVNDQIQGISPLSAAIRDGLSERAAKILEPVQENLGMVLAQRLRETKGASKAIINDAGEIDNIPGMVQGSPAPNTYSREINYRIAEMIQASYEVVGKQLAAANLHDDAELAFKVIQDNTNILLNRMLADTHVQVLGHLNDMGLSLMSDAPDVGYAISRLVDVSPGTGIRSMEDILNNPDEKWVTEFWGKKGPNDRLEYRSNTAKALRAHIPKVLQTHHDNMIKFFFNDAKHTTFSWEDIRAAHEVRVNAAGVEGDIRTVNEQLLKLVDSLELPADYVPPTTGAGMHFGSHMEYGGKATESTADILKKWVSFATELNLQNHTTDTVSLGTYSLYDYWTLGYNTSKETRARNVIKLDAINDEKIQIGRAAYLDTAREARKRLSETDSGIVNEALDAIPPMDEEFTRLTQIIHGWLAETTEKSMANGKRADLRRLVASTLVPDLKRVAQGEKFEQVNSAAAMKTLGSHVFLLSDTTKTGSISGAEKVLLAQKVWKTPVKIKQMNEAVLLYNLHHTLVMGADAKTAAAAIARRLEKHPEVAKLMNEANVQGTTNGAAGLRRAHPSTLDATPQADVTKATTPPVVGEELGDLTSKLEKAKIASQQRREAEAATQTIAADAAVAKKEAVEVSKAADSELAKQQEIAANVKAVDTNLADASTPATQQPDVMGPGGFTHPVLSDDELEKIDALIMDLTGDTNFAKINISIDEAINTMNGAMADYQQKIAEGASQFDMKTRRMLKVFGAPVMSLGRTRSSGMTQYAGLAGMKERQGVVHNWLNQRNWYQNHVSATRRPTSLHDGMLEEMRRTTANLGQQEMILTYNAVRATYKAYPSRAALAADQKNFFTPDYAFDIEGLAPLNDRLLSITNELDARVARGLDRIGQPIDKDAAYLKAMDEELETLNSMMPRPYKLRKDTFIGKNRFTNDNNHEPWSREWINDLSDYLEANHRSHPLARSNLKKLDLQSFENASQTAASRMRGGTNLHDSMFDNFTFSYDPRQVEVLNQNRPAGSKYVEIGSHHVYKNLSSVYGNVKNRYATEDMLNEMSKITEFYQRQFTNMRDTGADVNFRMGEKINNHWKSMVTMWNIPRYHIGNVMADGFLSAMDGVGVGSYRKASIVMGHSHPLRRKLGEDPESYAKMLRPDSTLNDVASDDNMIGTMAGELADPKRAMHVTSISVGGKNVTLTSEDVMKVYLDYGLSSNQISGNIARSASGGRISAAGEINDKVLDLSNGREDYFRIAHLIHAIENEALIPGRTQTEIFKAARDRVIKYHFDYGDVSEVERLTVGKYIPFYKWSRNIVPLAVTQMFTNPKSYIIGNAANNAMGEMMYPTEYDAEGNEIPVQFVTPNWVGDSNLVPIGTYTDPDGNEQAKYAVLNLPLDEALGRWIMPFIAPWQNPTTGVASKASSSVRAVAQTGVASSHPLIRSLIQATTGRTVVPGDSYPTSSEFSWLTDLGLTIMPPQVSQIMRQQKDADANKVDGSWLMDNWIGVIRETHATEASVKGTLREEADIMKPQQIKATANWMKQNYPGIDPNSEEGKEIVHDYFVQQGILQR